MRVRRLLATGVVVLLAGCAGTTAQPTAPVVIPSDPVAAFAAAKARLGTESARFSETTPGSDRTAYTGVVDARTRNWEVTGKEYVVRRVGTDLFVKMSGRTLADSLVTPATHDQFAAGRWVRTHLPVGREMSVVFNDAFPWNLANPAINAHDLKRTGDRTFSGTLTIKDSIPHATPRPAVAAPVTVDLDDQGRFARISLVLDPAKKPAPPAVITFSGFGRTAGITAPPAADVLYDDDTTLLNQTLLE